jgi:hypothetical protein
MKKIFLVLYLCCFNLFAKNIPLNKAENVAVNWVNEKANLFYSKQNISSVRYITNGNDTLFYLFEFSPKGYIVVSYDDCAIPVVMYNYNDNYSENMPPAVQEYFDVKKKELLLAKASNLQSSSSIKQLWDTYSEELYFFKRKTVTEKVGPLISVKWGQGYPYNKFCPITDTSGVPQRTYAGCVALAFAQVIKFHNWPICGEGSFEYVYYPFGTISANFGETFYEWNKMIDQIYEWYSDEKNIDAIAKLIFHCGVAVKMEYGPGGSGAETTDIRDALVKYFRYSDDAVILYKNDKANSIPYSDEEWQSILKNELINGRPFVYRGNNVWGYRGHAFVIHGFEENYFEVNFGWSGGSDGFYYLGNIAISDDYNFSYDNVAIINIIPETGFGNISFSSTEEEKPLSFDLLWEHDYDFEKQHYTVELSLKPDMDNITKSFISEENIVHIHGLLAGNRYYGRILFVSKDGGKEYSPIFTFATQRPEVYSLLQNYPNPFNPKTTIRFSLRESSKVKLTIYSALGQHVATLVDNFLESKEYEINWDAGGYSSGIYFCNLETTNYKNTIKLVLIK